MKAAQRLKAAAGPKRGREALVKTEKGKQTTRGERMKCSRRRCG